MKKGLKKILCILSLTIGITGTAVSAYAIPFNVTPPGDPFSYSVKKADSEQYAYFTGTKFANNSSVLHCVSWLCENHIILSDTAHLSASNTHEKEKYKNGYAPAGKLFEMYTDASTSNFNVEGRYTP